MQLKSIEFKEFEGTEREWTLEGLSLCDRNLIVGKNATGKTRALNIIHALARNLAGLQSPVLSADYDVTFINGDKHLRYQLKCEEQQVLEEVFSVDDSVLLQRGKGGEGEIWAETEKKRLSFQTPVSQLAAVARRDTIQHDFLEPLYAWGSSLRLYRFGSSLGKDHMPVFVEKGGGSFDERNPNHVVAMYRNAAKELKEEFNQAVMADMRTLGYDIEGMGLEPPVSVRVVSELPGELMGLYVKERELQGNTDQHSMSQGMFRALSILIQLNYSQLTNTAMCILIDDIGEGLDFERSCSLIDLLRKKAQKSHVQLILSTNDRFVMNHVPLEEWSFLQRQGGHVRVRNYENSREMFDEFKFTGLSNFSFLEMDFPSGQPVEEAAANE